MASVIHHFNEQLKAGDEVRLFAGSDGYADGGQLRDFVHVDDIVAVNLWAMERGKSGIFNVGTGQARSFNDVANAVLRWHGRGRISYIPFPAQSARQLPELHASGFVWPAGGRLHGRIHARGEGRAGLSRCARQGVGGKHAEPAGSADGCGGIGHNGLWRTHDDDCGTDETH
jgi:hypothetical protein